MQLICWDFILESHVFREKQMQIIDPILDWFRLCSLRHYCIAVYFLSYTVNSTRFFRCTISKKYFLISFNLYCIYSNSCVFDAFLWAYPSKKAKICIPEETLNNADHHYWCWQADYQTCIWQSLRQKEVRDLFESRSNQVSDCSQGCYEVVSILL